MGPGGDEGGPPQRPSRSPPKAAPARAPHHRRGCFCIATLGRREAAPKVALPERSRPWYGARLGAAVGGLERASAEDPLRRRRGQFPIVARAVSRLTPQSFDLTNMLVPTSLATRIPNPAISCMDSYYRKFRRWARTVCSLKVGTLWRAEWQSTSWGLLLNSGVLRKK